MTQSFQPGVNLSLEFLELSDGSFSQSQSKTQGHTSTRQLQGCLFYYFLQPRRRSPICQSQLQQHPNKGITLFSYNHEVEALFAKVNYNSTLIKVSLLQITTKLPIKPESCVHIRHPQSSIQGFFQGFCDVAKVVISCKISYPTLATYQIWKQTKSFYILGYLLGLVVKSGDLKKNSSKFDEFCQIAKPNSPDFASLCQIVTKIVNDFFRSKNW